MKFWEIFHFEVAFRLRRVSTWIYFVLLVALTLMMVDGILIQEAKGSGNTIGNIHANAPVLITMATIALSMIGLVVTAALFGDAAARDVQTRMHPIFFTVPFSKADYLGGRFLGALVVNVLLLAVVPFGLMLGLQMQDLEPELLGPFRLEAFLQPYFTILLPNLLVTAAILFAMAALSRRALAGYAGGLLLFLCSVVAMEATSKQKAYREVAAYLDPFGFTATHELWAYWTPFEQNTQLVGLDGILLWNRLIWACAAAGVLAFLYLRFRFAHEGERGRRRRGHEARPGVLEAVRERTGQVVVPRSTQAFDFGVRVRQAFAVARRSFGEVAANRYAFILLAVSLVFLFVEGWDAGFVLDTPTWPVTYVIARGAVGDLTPIIYLLVALYAGELVWRERDAGVSEVTDAAPVPNWVPLVGKFGALVLALVVLQAVLMAGGVLLQALRGYYDFELGLYVQILFGFQLADYVLWAGLAMLVHVLVDQKYLGHLVFVVYYVFSRFGRSYFGIEHNLLVYPADPGWTYSDMSGFSPFLAPYLWFKLYWGAWVILFAVAANLFWRRGREHGVRHRFREAGLRFTRPAAVTAAVAVVLVLTTGGFVFYNTNVLNEYRPRDERIARLVEYERRYKQYEDAEQPRIAGAGFHIEIYPDRPAAALSGSYLLLNRSAGPIDSVHLMVDPTVEVRRVDFDRAARRVLDDPAYGYRIFALGEALAPGDSLRMTFDLTFRPRGFPNRGINTAVVENGTYFDQDLLPALGYRPELELTSESLRREYGLPPREALPSVYDVEARWRRPRNTEWFHAEVVIGTDEDQIALAPGALRRTWAENGRRYFHYVTDAPIKDVFAFLSARYAVREDCWQAPSAGSGQAVDIRIYHHLTHTYNLDRMVQGVKASLDYYTEHFGPYPYGQLWIAEVPRHAGTFARALPNSVAYSEGFGFIARAEDGIDYPFAVTAHEVAHQWWGGQIAPAEAQGSRVLYETLAHYSTLMVLEKTYGPEQVRRFLDLFLHRYLVGRQNRGRTEVPLLLSEDQDYIHYHKGAVVMYALRDYVGEKQVNTALRRFLDEHRFGGPPYPTTLDLYEELQAVTPDSLQYLLTDLFEEITVWDMRTLKAQAEPTGTGAYRVTLEVEAYKMKADSVGRARRVPMDDLVDVGVFAAAEDGAGLGAPLYLRKHRIRSGEQTITVTVPRAPARAGIDPYHRLIEWRRDDNAREVAPGKDSAPRARAPDPAGRNP